MNPFPRLFRPAFAVAALGLLAALAMPAASAAPVRILPLGDSLTQTYPGYRAPLFAALRSAGHDVEFVGPKSDTPKPVADGPAPDPRSLAHAGYGGFTIGPGPSKADAWTGGKGNLHAQLETALASRPDIVLLLIGTNEYFNVGDLDPAYKPDRDGPARLAALLDRIHQLSPGSRVLVSSIMPVAWDKNFARPFNAALPGLVSTRPYALFADLNSAAAFTAGDWSKDNLHPSDQGYAKMASAWFAALEPLLPARR